MLEKNMLRLFASVVAVAPVLVSSSAMAQKPQKATVGIHTVDVIPSLMTKVQAGGREKGLALERVAESLGQQLIDRVQNTRKFAVVSRSDLKTILKDQELQSVLSDPSDTNIAHAFKVAGCKYALIPTVDDFQDLEKELNGTDGAVVAWKRTVRLSVVMKIYDTTSAKLLESASQVFTDEGKGRRQGGVNADGREGDDLMAQVSRDMAQKLCDRVVDVVYPAKVLQRTGQLVTINRGDGTGIAEGQKWDVFAPGKTLIDPDTGENLGSEEIPVGLIEIVRVLPKFAQGKVLEDYGIDTGHIVRRAKKD